MSASALAACSAGCSWLAQPEGCERDSHCREGYVCVATVCEAAPEQSDAGRRDDAGVPLDDAGPAAGDAGAVPGDAGSPFDDAGNADGGDDGGAPLDLDPLDGGPPAPASDGGGAQILNDGRGDSGPLPDGGPALDAGALDDGREDGGDAGDVDGGPPLPGEDGGEDENGRPLE